MLGKCTTVRIPLQAVLSLKLFCFVPHFYCQFDEVKVAVLGEFQVSVSNLLGCCIEFMRHESG